MIRNSPEKCLKNFILNMLNTGTKNEWNILCVGRRFSSDCSSSPPITWETGYRIDGVHRSLVVDGANVAVNGRCDNDC